MNTIFYKWSAQIGESSASQSQKCVVNHTKVSLVTLKVHAELWLWRSCSHFSVPFVPQVELQLSERRWSEIRSGRSERWPVSSLCSGACCFSDHWVGFHTEIKAFWLPVRVLLLLAENSRGHHYNLKRPPYFNADSELFIFGSAHVFTPNRNLILDLLFKTGTAMFHSCVLFPVLFHLKYKANGFFPDLLVSSFTPAEVCQNNLFF